MGFFLLWATWAHEHMAIFVQIDGHRMSGRLKRAEGRSFFTKLGQHVNEMIAGAVKKVKNFSW